MQFIFAGFLIVPSDMPAYWRYTVRYISFFTYGFGAVINNAFLGTPNEPLLIAYVRLSCSRIKALTYEPAANRWRDISTTD